jgi:uncharacterized membrane protein YccC
MKLKTPVLITLTFTFGLALGAGMSWAVQKWPNNTGLVTIIFLCFLLFTGVTCRRTWWALPMGLTIAFVYTVQPETRTSAVGESLAKVFMPLIIAQFFLFTFLGVWLRKLTEQIIRKREERRSTRQE